MPEPVEKLLKNPDSLHHMLLSRAPASNEQPVIPPGWGEYPSQLTDASVLLLLQPDPEGTLLWFVQRSADLRKHAGQIAFPGGKRDLGDRDLWHTALREGHEEIGLDPSGVKPLGQLDECWTPSGFRIHPFLGWNLGSPPSASPNSEIERAFCLPVVELLGAEQGEPPWPRFATPFGLIWGATGRILHSWLRMLQEAST